MKKVFKNIIEVLGGVLVTTGEFGLILFGLSFLWTIGKLEFFTVLALVGIITVIDKIKEYKKHGE